MSRATDASGLDDLSLKREFCACCRLLYDRRLVTGVGGNVSARMGKRILLTPSGYSLRDLAPQDLIVSDRRGRTVEGANPTRDAGLHLRILRRRPDINIVFHVHGAYVVAASTLLRPGPDTLPPLTPGFVHFAYPLPMLPFMVPGTEPLARMAARALSEGRQKALLLQNHGLVVLGRDFSEAINIAEEIDEAARVYLLTRGTGTVIPESYLDLIRP